MEMFYKWIEIKLKKSYAKTDLVFVAMDMVDMEKCQQKKQLCMALQ